MLEDLVKTCLEDIIPSIIMKIQDNEEEEKKIKIQIGKFCQKRSFEKYGFNFTLKIFCPRFKKMFLEIERK